jgi:hypothetical protein
MAVGACLASFASQSGWTLLLLSMIFLDDLFSAEDVAVWRQLS